MNHFLWSIEKTTNTWTEKIIEHINHWNMWMYYLNLNRNLHEYIIWIYNITWTFLHHFHRNKNGNRNIVYIPSLAHNHSTFLWLYLMCNQWLRVCFTTVQRLFSLVEMQLYFFKKFSSPNYNFNSILSYLWSTSSMKIFRNVCTIFYVASTPDWRNWSQRRL